MTCLKPLIGPLQPSLPGSSRLGKENPARKNPAGPPSSLSAAPVRPCINPGSVTIQSTQHVRVIAPTTQDEPRAGLGAGWEKKPPGVLPASAFPCPPRVSDAATPPPDRRSALSESRDGLPHQPGRCSLVLPSPPRLTAPLPEIIPFPSRLETLVRHLQSSLHGLTASLRPG